MLKLGKLLTKISLGLSAAPQSERWEVPFLCIERP